MTWALDLARAFEPKQPSAALFGIVVYTDAHPNVKKVMRDDDYWSALDEISGPLWPVFSVRARQGHSEMPSFPPGTFGHMVAVWREPVENRDLLDVFEIRSTQELPALVVFAEDDDGLMRTVVPLSDDSPESAFATLKSTMSVVAEALERVDKENLGVPAGVMTAVKFALDGYKDRKRVRHGYRILRELRGWLPAPR